MHYNEILHNIIIISCMLFYNSFVVKITTPYSGKLRGRKLSRIGRK